MRVIVVGVDGGGSATRVLVTDGRGRESIPVQSESFSFTTDREYYPQNVDASYALLRQDPAIERAAAVKLAAIYQSTRSTAWKFLDVREIAMVKKQSLELRPKR